jgi:two-component system cell cycle sensor histidine kinase/response regulator CckA
MSEIALDRTTTGQGETEFRRLLETLPAGAYTCDRSGLITYYNREAARLWGRHPRLNDPVDRFCGSFRLFGPDGAPITHDRCWMALALEQQQGYNGCEIVVERPDGDRRSALAYANPIYDESGSLVGAVNVLVDITDRKHAEEALSQSQRMEAVGRLAGGIAHDLNNMLLAITGYAEFLSRALDEQDGRRADLEQIKLCANRSAALTAQLLAFARRDVVQPRPLDLNVLISRSERMLRPLLGESIELQMSLAEGDAMVHADPGRLEQALLNLVFNARDAMPRGGRLLIETRKALLDKSAWPAHGGVKFEPGRYVVLSVTDTGHGMDRSTLARVFEPFFTTKGVGQGTGLGLAMVYGTVKRAGGFIWAYSEPEVGTVFRIYLPAGPGPAREPEGPEPSGMPEPRDATVLVVEDEAVVRDIVRQTLEDAGYRCLTAASGSEALELVRRQGDAIDLVIADAVMPGMNGGEAVARIQALRPGLAVLFTSGFSEDDVLRRGLIGRGEPFIQKPFSPDALADRVAEILRVQR